VVYLIGILLQGCRYLRSKPNKKAQPDVDCAF